MSLPEGVKETEIDGVPVYWSEDDDRAGDDLRAILLFRVGHADEQLAIRGITHVIEHLALHQAGGLRHEYNGQVDAVSTVFATRGTPEEVAEFLSSVCRSLHGLPLDRLEIENRVLRTEADGQGGAAVAPLLVWRYGAATYGLSGYEEFGVGRHQPEELIAWAGRWFTRGNAVLALVGGPPPAGLRLDLPAGDRVPAPEPSSALPRTPAYFQTRFNGIAMSAIMPRGTPGQAYAALLTKRLQAALRMDDGVSYSPFALYEQRDHATAQVLAVADGLKESHAALAARFVAEVERLATTAPTDDEIGQVRRKMQAAMRAAEPGSIVVTTALDALLGREPISQAEAEQQIAELTPDSVREFAAEALGTALFMMPLGQQPKGTSYRSAPDSSLIQVEGRTLRSVDFPVNRDRLIVGPSGITLIRGPMLITVRFEECEALLAWPDGARHLIGRDGFRVQVEPTLWHDGHTIPALIDAAVPQRRVVPRPQRPAEQIPQPQTSRRQRLRARWKKD